MNADKKLLRPGSLARRSRLTDCSGILFASSDGEKAAVRGRKVTTATKNAFRDNRMFWI